MSGSFPLAHRPARPEEQDETIASDRTSAQHDDAFVREAVKCAAQKRQRQKQLRTAGRDLARVITLVCLLRDADRHQITGPSRQRRVTDARAPVCYLATTDLGYTLAEVARLFGHSRSSALRAARRGKRIAEVLGLTITQ